MKAQGIGSTYRQKLSKVINVSKEGITAELVSRTLGVSRQEAGRLLSRWQKSGWLQKIKRGFYVSIPVESTPEQLAIENPWGIVSKIFSPGYIGGFSAIKHWDLSEQIFETIVFFTTKKVKDRHPTYSGLRLHLKTIKSEKLFGLKAIWIDSTKIQVSDPSKTMIDFMDDPALGGGMTVIREFLHAYLDSDHKNIPLLSEYADKIGNGAVYKRLGFMLEVMGAADEKMLKMMQKKISKGYSEFDPSSKSSRIIRKWNLKVSSSWAKEYDSKK